MGASEPERTELDQAREQIAREIARIHVESYGVGTEGVTVDFVRDAVLVIVDSDLTVSERTLLDAGNRDIVRTVRRSFQEAIAPTFAAVVERATGRRVRSFLSEMSVDPVYSIEFFRLEPEAPLSGD
jgi:uncharacterized protein YbcI